MPNEQAEAADHSFQTSLRLTRRGFTRLGVIGLGISASGFRSAAWAQADTQDLFVQVSQTLTGFSKLDPALAERIAGLLAQHDPKFASTLSSLNTILRAKAGAAVKIDDISDADAKALAQKLLFVWYTGTLDDVQNAPMVAYRDALMFQTVRDGLPAPTYCFNGPAWWTAKPPTATEVPQ